MLIYFILFWGKIKWKKNKENSDGFLKSSLKNKHLLAYTLLWHRRQHILSKRLILTSSPSFPDQSMPQNTLLRYTEKIQSRLVHASNMTVLISKLWGEEIKGNGFSHSSLSALTQRESDEKRRQNGTFKHSQNQCS